MPEAAPVRGSAAPIAAVAVAGVLTGNELCSYAFVHRAAARLPMPAEVALEKQLTRSMMAPMAVLMTATIGVNAAAAARSVGGSRRLGLAATGSYGLMLLITLVGNMPLNAATLRATTDMDAEQWRTTRRRWSRLHLARNLLNVTGLALATAAATACRKDLAASALPGGTGQGR